MYNPSLPRVLVRMLQIVFVSTRNNLQGHSTRLQGNGGIFARPKSSRRGNVQKSRRAAQNENGWFHRRYYPFPKQSCISLRCITYNGQLAFVSDKLADDGATVSDCY
jgi:hypothetical protein